MAVKLKLNRRTLRSLVSDRHSHLNLAILSSVFIFFPFCISAVIAIQAMSANVVQLADTGTAPTEIMEWVGSYAGKATMLLACVYVLVSLIAAYLALKVTHQVVGPLQKLEDQLDALAKGDYSARSALRKNDYLGDLSKRLNELAAKLESQSKP